MADRQVLVFLLAVALLGGSVANAAMPVNARDASSKEGSGASLFPKDWEPDCRGDRCLMEHIIRQDGGRDVDYLDLMVLVEKSSGAVLTMGFSLPPDADRGESLIVGFADHKRDERGQDQIEITPDSTYAFNVYQCTKTSCVVQLLQSYPDADGKPTSQDFLNYMMNNSFMFVNYKQMGVVHKTLTALQIFRDRYRTLTKATH